MALFNGTFSEVRCKIVRFCFNRWFCHFDDDNYVNVQSLLSLLSQYDEQRDWYLGKPSIKAPLELSYVKSPPNEVLWK